MEYGLNDTDPETARVHLEMIRRASAERRLRLAFSLSRTAMTLSKAGLARRLGETGSREVGLGFVALLYGPLLADAVRTDLETRHA